MRSFGPISGAGADIKEGSNVPRKGHIQKRDVLADPLYNNKVVTKLINNIMLDGKEGCCTENRIRCF